MVEPKLIIHLDVNGTIMPADPTKCKHVKSMLNIHLSKQAFVRRVDEEDASQIVWWDGTPFHKGDRPPILPQFRYTCHIREHYGEDHVSHEYPLEDSVSLEDFNSIHDKCDNFTAKHLPGAVYEPELMNLMDKLEWKHTGIDPVIADVLTLPVAQGRRMNIFVPAFLELLRYLHTSGRDFAIVIRTFGSDIPRLMPAFDLIARGLHPDLPVSGCISSPSAVGFLGHDVLSNDFKLSLSEPESLDIIGSDRIVSFLESLPTRSVVMINDDYDWWKQHSFLPVFGKPVWVDLNNSAVRHILFDDNVNIDPSDSIACVWLRGSDGTWTPQALHSPAGKATIGTVLMQASLYFSIMQKDCFVSELTKAEQRYTTLASRIQQ